MNDNTIIRIKVPASLYESVKAKLMIKEEASPLQKLEEAKAKIEKMISEAKKADPKKAAEEKKKAEDKKKAEEKKKKEAEAKKKKMEEAKDSEKPTPADLERSKKISASLAKRDKDEYDNTTRMIALARAGKIRPAKTKK
jgi:hypothetical protein